MLIKNGNVHSGNGIVLYENDILINDNKITQIGSNIDYEGKDVIDASGKEVFPGFIDAVNNIGCVDVGGAVKDDNEDYKFINTNLEVKNSFNPNELMYQEYYKSGITSIGISPGNNSLIGGQTSVVRTFGKNISDMIVVDGSGMKACISQNVLHSVGNKSSRNFPTCRVTTYQRLESVLKNAQKELIAGTNLDNPMHKVLKKEMPLIITADDMTEIQLIVNLMGKFDINVVIHGGYEAYKVVDLLIENKIPLILGDFIQYSKIVYCQCDFAVLAQACNRGLELSVSTTGLSGTSGRESYFWNMSELMKSGLDKEEAVKVMTYNPAKALGAEQLVGTIEVGKLADIVIYNNNPVVTYDAHVEYTIINGKIVYAKDGENKCC